MSSCKTELEEGNVKQEGILGEVNLFQVKGVKYPEVWQCVSYIAPTNEKKNWKAKDAIATYCEVCKKIIPYDSKRNSKAVLRHMLRNHQDLLNNFGKKNETKKRKEIGNKFTFSREVKRTKSASGAKSALEAKQMQFTKLFAKWTAGCLRPYSISEDQELQTLITFATRVDGDLKLPSRDTNKAKVNELAEEIKTKMKIVLRDKCKFYSCTSNMWSSRTINPFMAFTVHFLCDDFQRYTYNLGVKPAIGMHKSEMIQTQIQDFIDEWGLSKHNIGMMLCDSGSNMVQACQDWAIPCFPCIGHSLHLVVGPFLVEKKNLKNSGNTVSGNDGAIAINKHNEERTECTNEEDEDIDDLYSDDFTDSYNNDALKHIRKIVSKMLEITKFVKNTKKYKDKLEELQIAEVCDQVLWAPLDVRTRWNSTLKMLTRVLEIKEPLKKFLQFYKSPQGTEEFCDSKTKLETIEDEEWAFLDGICHLLSIFDSATKVLSDKKYSSFVTAFPILRKIMDKIDNDSMFAFHDETDIGTSTFKMNFYRQYANEAFFESVVRLLNSYRLLLLAELKKQFKKMDVSVMWTTLLDPRFSLKSCHWRNDHEKNRVKQLLSEHVEQFAVRKASTIEESSIANDDSGDEDEFNLFAKVEVEDEFDLFAKKGPSETAQSTMTMLEKVKIQAQQEVLMYLGATETIIKPNFQPLEWWSGNRHRYPNVAAVARKWLSVPAMSTPSERASSICGILNMAKQSNSNGEYMENQVFVYNNKSLLD